LEDKGLLEFSILSSGSSGNAVFIRTKTTKILLDAGISGKQIAQRLKQSAGEELSALDAVLVTHEHVDHVRGLKQVSKLSRASLYSTEGTLHHIRAQLPEDMETSRIQIVKADTAFTVGDIHITPFTVSHDAEEPVAYRFDSGEHSLAVVTDLGYVSDHIKDVIRGCQCYVFESNHDIGMLRAGRYPWSLKRRILGDKGHLSNEDAAVALADVVGTQEVSVYLAHLSEENNQPDLAELTVRSVLREIHARYDEQVSLHRTSRYEPTQLHRLG
jgi:phosphoribosyl 1,2-cyclic phosphodiesterase